MILAVTGHRPPKLGGYYTPNPIYNAVKAGLLRKFQELQPSVVLTGMALGTDQWAAEVCYDNGIPYDAIVPFHGFESTWPDASKQHYQRLLGRARSTHVVSSTSTYSSGLLQRRNQWLVDHAVTLLGVWNGSSGGTANCISYARGRSKPIILVDLPADIWAMASAYEQVHTARRAYNREREVPVEAPPDALRLQGPTFRRRTRNLPINGPDPRNNPPPADPSLLINAFGGLYNPPDEEIRTQLREAFYRPVTIWREREEPRTNIPSPIKGDKQATPLKTGRIIDLDD